MVVVVVVVEDKERIIHYLCSAHPPTPSIHLPTSISLDHSGRQYRSVSGWRSIVEVKGSAVEGMIVVRRWRWMIYDTVGGWKIITEMREDASEGIRRGREVGRTEGMVEGL